MNYKEIYHRTLQLISSPATAWEEIRLEEDRRKVFTAFAYPMIGLCGLAVFIHSMNEMLWQDTLGFQAAMTSCCEVAVSLFGGYFLAAYLIDLCRVRFFGASSNLPLMQQFVGYAMVVVFLLKILTGLWPDFQMLAWLLQFYTVYVVWEGADRLLAVPQEQRLRFTLLASLLLVLCPALIGEAFTLLTALSN